MKKKLILVGFMVLWAVVLSFALVACSSDKGIYVPGTYTGTGTGMGPITVDLTVDDNNITSVVINGPAETQGVGGKEAIENDTFANQMLETQSVEVDVVSGATLTSNGVVEASRDALAQALRENQ
jgi:uncharacterized protein with FMN-binding domain